MILNNMPQTQRDIMVFWLCLAIVGLILSVFVLGLAMLGLFVTACVVCFRKKSSPRFRFSLPLLALTLPFFLVLYPGWPLEDPGYWLSRLRIKLPFLLLPPAFMVLPALRPSDRLRIYRFAGMVLSLTTLLLTIYYMQHWETLSEAMKQGRPLPVPQNHIRFSLLIGIVSLALLIEYLPSFWRERRFSSGLVMGLWLFLFLHMLSVRSGLVAVYLAMFVLLARHVFSSGKKLPALVGLFSLLLLPWLAWRFLPSVQAKVGYMLYDIEQFRKGEAAGYADSGRLLSWQIGWELFREQPWTGTGIGHLKQAVAQKYALYYPDAPVPLLPHNQFLSVLAASGIPGLLLFLFATGAPLFPSASRRNPTLLAFWIVLMASCMVENTLENALGVGLFLIFLLPVSGEQ